MGSLSVKMLRLDRLLISAAPSAIVASWNYGQIDGSLLFYLLTCEIRSTLSKDWVSVLEWDGNVRAKYIIWSGTLAAAPSPLINDFLIVSLEPGKG